MNYRKSQAGEGWQLDWMISTPYAYAEKVDVERRVRWEIVRVAPYTLDGIRGLVQNWEDRGRIGAVIYSGYRVGFPVRWVEEALTGKGKHQPDKNKGANYGESRLAFDHSQEAPFFGFDHDSSGRGFQL